MALSLKISSVIEVADVQRQGQNDSCCIEHEIILKLNVAALALVLRDTMVFYRF